MEIYFFFNFVFELMAENRFFLNELRGVNIDHIAICF